MSTTIAQQSRPAWFGPHSAIRTDVYVLLAALLRDSPPAEVIDLLAELDWQEDLPTEMQQALSELCRAGTEVSFEDIQAEYQRVFVGLGSGELVPYASWYGEKLIQSTPLAEIRGDLQRLGIVRQVACFESEDHAGVLCEIMALLSSPGSEIAAADQAAFFTSHVGTWMPVFFHDLKALKQLPFYRKVAEFGRSFLAAEAAFLQHDAA